MGISISLVIFSFRIIRGITTSPKKIVLIFDDHRKFKIIQVIKLLRDLIHRLPTITLVQAKRAGGFTAQKRKFLYHQVFL